MKIANLITKKLVLTGTPIQNNLTELHCIFNFIDNEVLGDLRSFKQYYEKVIVRGTKVSV